jgi:hypothetical protein
MTLTFARWTILSLALALPVAAQGSLYVVDDGGGPGVHFTDLPPAIAAAQAGDVIEVRDGVYSAFVLAEGLTLIGVGDARVRHGSSIQNVPAGETAVLVNMHLSRVLLQGCAGPVVFDQGSIDTLHSQYSGLAPLVEISGCADVRMYRVTIAPGFANPGAHDGRGAVRVGSSRLELVRCAVYGGPGHDENPNVTWDGGYGGWGVSCDPGARVHFALTSVRGGEGGVGCWALCSAWGGDGGAAILVGTGATTILAGLPSDLIKGGAGGYGAALGSPGYGVYAQSGATVRWSGVDIQDGGPPAFGLHANPGSTIVHPVPDDPTLERVGSPEPGAIVTLRLHAAPGTYGRLQQGGVPIVVDDGLAGIEKLTNRIRLHPLGLVGGSGLVATSLQVPAAAPLGQLRLFQGLEIDPLGGVLVERTNSVPVVVR